MASRYNLRSRNSTNNSDSDDDRTPKHNKPRKGVQSRTPPMTDSDGDDSSDDNFIPPQSPLEQRSVSDLETDSGPSFLDDNKYGSPLSTTGSISASTPSPVLSHRSKPASSSTLDQSKNSPTTQHGRSSPTRPEEGSPPYVPRYPDVQLMDKSSTYLRGLYIKYEVLFHILICVLICVLVLVAYSHIIPANKQIDEIPETKFKAFVTRVNKLKDMFPSQDDRTWKTLKSSVRHVLDGKNPYYPAVILFAVDENSSKLGTCFVRQAAKRFDNSSQLKGYIDCRKSSHLDSGAEKLDLDKKIHAYFQTENVVVIDHVEALSPTAALLFHGICDNDNAPFKDVLITLVFHLDIPLDVKAREVEVKVEEYLKRELDVDKVGAMLSRIANNIIVIRQEQNENVHQVCS